MKRDSFLYLSHKDLDALGLGYGEIVAILEKVFVEKAEGRTSLPPKHWIERGGNDRFYSAMSSAIPGLGFGGCKWQSGDPANPTRGLPYIQGLYILSEDETGQVIAVMAAPWITAKRTAAASALAVKHLAKPAPRSLAILGCGLQGRAHLEAIKEVVPSIERCRAYDIRPEVTRDYVATMPRLTGVEVVATSSPGEAVSGCDVVISGGPILTPPRPSPAIEPGWIVPGCLGVAIDYDSYWKAETMQAMDLIATDDRGQIEHLREYQLFLDVPRLDVELGEILTGRKPGRRTAEDRILCFNLGIALEDLGTAAELYRRATERKIGTALPL